MISRKDVSAPASFEVYVREAGDDSLMPALKKSTRQFRKLLKKIPAKKIDYAYADGKWTIREVLQHVIDAERVFAYRALWFARKDPSPLPGFDENSWAANSKAATKDWDDLVDEFKSVRASTEYLFSSLDEEQLKNTGISNGNAINVAALGFVCAGHLMHHDQIIRERYLAKKELPKVKLKKAKKAVKESAKKKSKAK
jgi:hypothetical protein